MTMSTKILPISSISPLHCYLNGAFKTDIHLAYPKLEGWFYSNYVNLYALPEILLFLSNDFVNKEEPLLHYDTISKDNLLEWNINIIYFLRQAIDQGKYINTDLNEKFLSYSGKQYDYVHDAFIYGYNDDKKIFYMRGFNKTGLYGSVIATYDEVEQAYKTSLNVEKETFINLIKPNELTEKYPFDLYRFHIQLDDYYHSTNYTYRDVQLDGYLHNREDVVFGLQCYDMIREKIHQNAPPNENLILFHTLWEHKNIMLLRIRFMEKYAFMPMNNKIYLEYQKIANDAMVIRNIALRNKISQKNSSISNIYTIINRIESAENKVLPLFLKYTEKEYLKYRLVDYPKLKLNKIILPINKKRTIGNTQVFNFNETDNSIYNIAAFDFYKIKKQTKIEIRKDNLNNTPICQFVLDANSSGSCVFPFNQTLTPEYGKKLDIFITTLGDAQLRSFGFFKKLTVNSFIILPYYIIKIENADKQDDGTIFINSHGSITYFLHINKFFCDLFIDGVNHDLEVFFDGQKKTLENQYVSFECCPGNHTITLSTTKPTIIKSVKCCCDLSKSTSAVEYDIINSAQNGSTQKNGNYVHFANHDSYIGFYNVNFYKKFTYFHLLASGEGPGNDGFLDIKLGSPKGKILGTCKVTHTNNWDNYVEFSCEITAQTGRYDLYLVWRGNNKNNLFNIKSFRFE